MINTIKKNTILSIFFLVIVIIIYCLPQIIDRDYYRNFLGIITVYIFYPFLFMSIYFSIINLILINSNKEAHIQRKWIVFSLLSIIFTFYFIFKITMVMSSKVVG